MKKTEIKPKPFEQLKRGLYQISTVVKETLGPSGKNILIDRGSVPPLSTRDGVTVAKFVNLSNRTQNFAAMLVKEAALQTNAIAGDGTSTATVLTKAIFDAGEELLKEGINPIELKRSLDDSVGKVMKELDKLAKPIKTRKDVEAVATISANNDSFLGKIIAEGVHKVGEKGSVLVENATTDETSLKFQDGIVLERGFGETSIYFADPHKRTAIHDDPLVCIIADRVMKFEPLMPVLQHCIQKKKPLLLFVRDIDEEILAVLIKNKLQKGLKCVVLKLPGFDDVEIIKDLATSVQATVYSNDLYPLNDKTFDPDDLGTCKKAIVGFHDTTIIKGAGDIKERIKGLRNNIKEEEDEIVKTRLQDRINRLSNSVATILVAAESETERQDTKLRIEDAINAAKASMKSGVVAGGGLALHCVKGLLENTAGDKLLKSALSVPLKAIIENTGIKSDEIMPGLDYPMGYNAKTGNMANMFDDGILDPVLVVKTALLKASSVAGMLLTTGSSIVYEEDDVKV